MRITTKFLLIFALSSVIFMVGFFLVLNYTLINKIRNIERTELVGDSMVITSVIESLIEDLRMHSLDFGGWDEMYEYTQYPDEEFVYENIDGWVDIAFGVVKAQILSRDGKIMHSFTEEEHLDRVSDEELSKFIYDNDIFDDTLESSSESGVGKIGDFSFFYATSIITETFTDVTDDGYYVIEEDTPIGGIYFVIRFFDDHISKQISDVVGLPVDFHIPGREAGMAIGRDMCPVEPCGIVEERGDIIVYHQPLLDEDNNIVVYSEFLKSRDTFTFFIGYVRILTLLVTGIATAFLLFLMLVVWRMVTRPLKKLSDDISEIDINNPQSLTQSKRPDEIGEVAKAFNRVLTTTKKYLQEITTKSGALEKANTQTKERLGTINKMNKYMVGRELEMDKLKKQAVKYKSILKKNKIDDPFSK